MGGAPGPGGPDIQNRPPACDSPTRAGRTAAGCIIHQPIGAARVQGETHDFPTFACFLCKALVTAVAPPIRSAEGPCCLGQMFHVKQAPAPTRRRAAACSIPAPALCYNGVHEPTPHLRGQHPPAILQPQTGPRHRCHCARCGCAGHADGAVRLQYPAVHRRPRSPGHTGQCNPAEGNPLATPGLDHLLARVQRQLHRPAQEHHRLGPPAPSRATPIGRTVARVFAARSWAC